MRESHSCTSSFLPQDEEPEPSDSLRGRRSSGSEAVRPQKVLNIHKKPHVQRRGSESSPTPQARRYLGTNGRLLLATADRSVSTSALGSQNTSVGASLYAAADSTSQVRNYTKDPASEKQIYYGRGLSRRSRSPEATSSATSTPPRSPRDQARPGSASGYRKRFLPATPSRPSRIISVRQEPGITASASAVIPLSRFQTSSPVSRLWSDSQDSSVTTIWRGHSDSTFALGDQQLRSRVDSDYYEAEETFDYTASRPLISPPVGRRLPAAGDGLRPHRSASVTRRNTAPGRERPVVEVRRRETPSDGRILGAQSHSNIGFYEHFDEKNESRRRVSSTLPHFVNNKEVPEYSDEEGETGIALGRSNSVRSAEGRRTLPTPQFSRSPWRPNMRKSSVPEKSTVYSNPRANRFQTSNEEEVDAIFQSESLRTAGRRILPSATPSKSGKQQTDSSTCNHVDEEVKIPLLSDPGTTPRRVNRSGRSADSSLSRAKTWGSRQRRQHERTDEPTSSEYPNTDTETGDEFVIVNSNNNNCLIRKDFAAESNEPTCSDADLISCPPSIVSVHRKGNGPTYYHGVGENTSPFYQGLASSNPSKYKRGLLKLRSPVVRYSSSPNSLELTANAVGATPAAVFGSNNRIDLLTVNKCTADSNAISDNIEDSRGNKDSCPKTDSAWC